MRSVTADEQTMNTWARVRHELLAIIVLTLLLLAMAMLSAPVASAADEARLQSNGAVQYRSGGVGKEEADALKQQSADYALTLEFASSRSAEGDPAPVLTLPTSRSTSATRRAARCSIRLQRDRFSSCDCLPETIRSSPTGTACASSTASIFPRARAGMSYSCGNPA